MFCSNWKVRDFVRNKAANPTVRRQETSALIHVERSLQHRDQSETKQPTSPLAALWHVPPTAREQLQGGPTSTQLQTSCSKNAYRTILYLRRKVQRRVKAEGLM